MKLEKELKWLSKYFKIKISRKFLSTNYFEKGYLDSMELVSFIVEIEKKFQIKIKQKHYENRDFATIGGLAKIINKLRKK